MASKSPIDLWFYFNPSNQSIEKVLCYHPLGVNFRSDKDWTGVIPENADATTDPGDYQIYSYDWDGPDAQVLIDDDFDIDDYDTTTPTPLKEFDKGTLTIESLRKYANLIYDGTLPSPEFDEDI